MGGATSIRQANGAGSSPNTTNPNPTTQAGSSTTSSNNNSSSTTTDQVASAATPQNSSIRPDTQASTAAALQSSQANNSFAQMLPMLMMFLQKLITSNGNAGGLGGGGAMAGGSPIGGGALGAGSGTNRSQGENQIPNSTLQATYGNLMALEKNPDVYKSFIESAVQADPSFKPSQAGFNVNDLTRSVQILGQDGKVFEHLNAALTSNGFKEIEQSKLMSDGGVVARELATKEQPEAARGVVEIL